MTLNLEQKVQDLLDGDEMIVNENANKNGKVFGTHRDLLAGAISKEYAINKLLPHNVAEAHKKGWIHFHDLDYTLLGYYNCMLIDFPNMLKNGFKIGGADIEAPKSLRTAAEVIPQIIVNVASNIYGGVSAHKIDEILEPYAEMSYQKYLTTAQKWIVGKEKQEEFAKSQTLKEIYDSCQGLEYELNSVFSSGGQTPFITFNFGQTTSLWGREIQKAILQVRLDGLGKEKRTAIFPKLIFTLKKGLNFYPEDPNYDIKQLALECSTKRIYPDILSYDKVCEIYGYFISPMGCRSFLPQYLNENGEEISYGRRNIGVCSLNLPNIALSTQTIDEFFTTLDERIQLVYESLMYRYDRLNEVQAMNAPILYSYGATGHRMGPETNVQHIFRNGEATASIGYIGLHEVATKFFGEDWQDNREAKEMTLNVLRRMDEWRDKWAEETGIAFSVYSTPAESLTDRFCRLDKKTFGSIEGITDKDWYTNSFHLVPTKKVDPFYKIDFESEYPALTTGGNICYVETHSLVKNVDALETIWDYAYDRVPYYGVNQPISKCMECHYQGVFDADNKGFYCPSCNNRNPQTLEVVERMCGYLSQVADRKPISGRVKEITSRVKHA